MYSIFFFKSHESGSWCGQFCSVFELALELTFYLIEFIPFLCYNTVATLNQAFDEFTIFECELNVSDLNFFQNIVSIPKRFERDQLGDW